MLSSTMGHAWNQLQFEGCPKCVFSTPDSQTGKPEQFCRVDWYSLPQVISTLITNINGWSCKSSTVDLRRRNNTRICLVQKWKDTHYVYHISPSAGGTTKRLYGPHAAARFAHSSEAGKWTKLLSTRMSLLLYALASEAGPTRR